jgi:trehalose synthase
MGANDKAISQMLGHPAALDQDPLWYKDAVIYQVHVKSFFDANNDGVGDFAGLIAKLDYIAGLGVTCVWLLPFYPSPRRDDGYDIAEYRGVHPDYGTLADARRFVQEAHKRGLRVITELVINHTSDQHSWFQRARQARPGSAARNFYVWSDNDQAYSGTRIIFLDTEKSNWTWDPVANAFFWHRFYAHQPDLNFDNPLVLKEVLKVMKFWLELGIDGLRLDAVPYLIEREGTSNENLAETHVILKKIRAELDRTFPGRMLLAEANMWPEDVQPYFGDGNECHMAFHFPLMPRMYMALAQEDRFPLTDILRQTPEIPPNCQWSIFLRNHDELTLEMVTNKERDYLWNFYAEDRRARMNMGIRRRLAPATACARRCSGPRTAMRVFRAPTRPGSCCRPSWTRSTASRPSTSRPRTSTRIRCSTGRGACCRCAASIRPSGAAACACSIPTTARSLPTCANTTTPTPARKQFSASPTWPRPRRRSSLTSPSLPGACRLKCWAVWPSRPSAS